MPLLPNDYRQELQDSGPSLERERQSAMALVAEPGSAHPLGTKTSADGVNFSLFSESATEVALLLFDRPAAIEPVQVIRLDPFQHKTFHFWHVFVRGCGPGIYYAFRVDGPADPGAGDRFNPNKVLISPYAKGISRSLWKRADAVGPEDNLATSMRCAVVDSSKYDWEGDRPLNLPLHESIIWQIELDDALADTKLIAEAWDAAGLYQVGHFPGDRWAEWNGRYRDDVRQVRERRSGHDGRDRVTARRQRRHLSRRAGSRRRTASTSSRSTTASRSTTSSRTTTSTTRRTAKAIATASTRI